jgi:uncharacterized DUF497 family protein
MVVVTELIWDEWNKEHIAKHDISVKEVEEICHGKHEEVESYRKRIQINGITKKGRKIIIILSPENRKLETYGDGIYYPLTAFEEVA